MSVLKMIAYFQNRRDEIPNQEAARELARTRNTADIHEIAENLRNEEPNVQSDCLKVLYELGYLAPELVAGYVDEFLGLLRHRSNRMVWGGMIALSTIASLQTEKIFPHLDEIKKTMKAGSVITNDAGMKVLAAVAAGKDEYRAAVVPFLLERLSKARPLDAPRYAEVILAAIDVGDRSEFSAILEKRMDTAEGSRLARLRKVHRQAGEIS